jgi:hypothetical protein
MIDEKYFIDENENQWELSIPTTWFYVFLGVMVGVYVLGLWKLWELFVLLLQWNSS